jgi:Kdo2-lipid IVA lauroyltransferase/acyltransferase
MQLNLSAFLQWKINILLCQKLGWNFAFIYIMVLGNLYFLFKRKEKKKVKEAVKMVFEKQKGPSEKKTIIRGVFQGILRHYYEKIFNVYNSLEKLKTFFNQFIKPDGISVIDQGMALGKGVLLITGHFGGIEFIPKYLATRNYPVTILAKFSSDHLKKISTEQAEMLAINLIDANNCSNIIKAIMHDLKENRIVITQCDEIEKWRPSSSKELSFLGRRIHLDKTINTLIKRVDTSVVFAVMHRSNNRFYRFIAHSSDELLTSLGQIKNTSLGERVLKLLEQYIYQYPEEWYQWKKVPEIKTTKDLAVARKENEPLAWLKPAYEITP